MESPKPPKKEKYDGLRPGNLGGLLKKIYSKKAIYLNHLHRIVLKITDDVYANQCLKIEFSSLESEKNRFPQVKYRYIK